MNDSLSPVLLVEDRLIMEVASQIEVYWCALNITPR